MTSDIVLAKNISSAYGDRPILNNVSLEVAEGEIFVIMGASGSGKTTLLRHLVGLQTPQTGHVELLRQRIDSIPKRALYELRKHVGVAFQNGALINSMSVLDNVQLPLRQHTTLDLATIRIMARMKLNMMALDDAEELMPSQLSGGMLKRAGLARAVAMDPKILFFDEPSAGLDPVTSAELDELILSLRDVLKMTVIVVTHQLESALKIADRMLVLADGKIAELGTVQEIARTNNPSVRALLDRQARPREPGDDAYINHLTEDNHDGS